MIREMSSRDQEPKNYGEEEWSPCNKQVKCSECGRAYMCVPEDDYYNSTCATDGVCESCLKIDNKVSEIIELPPDAKKE